MATFNASRQDRLCIVLGKSGVFADYAAFATQFGYREGGPESHRLPLKLLIDTIVRHGASVTPVRGEKVAIVQLGSTLGWKWQGNVVVKTYGSIEPMLEGSDATDAVGSTMFALWHRAARLVPDVVEPVGPIRRPFFDGNVSSFEVMVGALLKIYRQMYAAVSEESSGFGST